MSVLIQIDSGDPFFDLQTPPLEGTVYTLQFRWNIRAAAWFMNILDEQGTTMLQAGLRLVANWPLASYSTGRQPPGVFAVVDTSGQGTDPGLDDLGDRVQLIYYTTDDLGI